MQAQAHHVVRKHQVAQGELALVFQAVQVPCVGYQVVHGRKDAVVLLVGDGADDDLLRESSCYLVDDEDDGVVV